PSLHYELLPDAPTSPTRRSSDLRGRCSSRTTSAPPASGWASTCSPCHPGSPAEKPHIEKMMSAVATLFAQYVRGYLGSSVERRRSEEHTSELLSRGHLVCRLLLE